MRFKLAIKSFTVFHSGESCELIAMHLYGSHCSFCETCTDWLPLLVLLVGHDFKTIRGFGLYISGCIVLFLQFLVSSGGDVVDCEL